MTEEFLHFLWKFRLYKSTDLLTSDNKSVAIINPGQHNDDAGPDFINAKIKIADTIWAGNVEIHINSSDWDKHKHQHDDAYKNVILHVVHNFDKQIKRKNSTELIPTLELIGKYNDSIYNNYIEIIKSKSWIPCQNQIKQVDEFIFSSWLERLLFERLERKAARIQDALKQNQCNWEQTFYQFTAKNFGFKVNDVPFELLAKSIPQKYLAKHRNNPFQIEAMLLGQAGLLNESFVEEYPRLLKKEYEFLQNKFSLKPIEAHLWKFMRTRPVNFPTIRISQFVDLVRKSSGLFSSVIECNNIIDLKSLFQVQASSYWESHYTFDTKSKKKQKPLGETSIDNILINTAIPFLFAYSNEKGYDQLKQRALSFLHQIKNENNSIIKKWETLGVKAESAYRTQALLELKNEYCSNKRCLQCQIGNNLIKAVN